MIATQIFGPSDIFTEVEQLPKSVGTAFENFSFVLPDAHIMNPVPMAKHIDRLARSTAFVRNEPIPSVDPVDLLRFGHGGIGQVGKVG